MKETVMNEMTYDAINEIGVKLLAMPRPGEYEKSERVDFLLKTFSGRTDDFCGFMGHMRVELETKKKISKIDAIRLFDDIALAALFIGRDDGHDDAIKNYAPSYRFLLKDRRATA